MTSSGYDPLESAKNLEGGMISVANRNTEEGELPGNLQQWLKRLEAQTVVSGFLGLYCNISQGQIDAITAHSRRIPLDPVLNTEDWSALCAALIGFGRAVITGWDAGEIERHDAEKFVMSALTLLFASTHETLMQWGKGKIPNVDPTGKPFLNDPRWRQMFFRRCKKLGVDANALWVRTRGVPTSEHGLYSPILTPEEMTAVESLSSRVRSAQYSAAHIRIARAVRVYLRTIGIQGYKKYLLLRGASPDVNLAHVYEGLLHQYHKQVSDELIKVFGPSYVEIDGWLALCVSYAKAHGTPVPSRVDSVVVRHQVLQWLLPDIDDASFRRHDSLHVLVPFVGGRSFRVSYRSVGGEEVTIMGVDEMSPRGALSAVHEAGHLAHSLRVGHEKYEAIPADQHEQVHGLSRAGTP